MNERRICLALASALAVAIACSKQTGAVSAAGVPPLPAAANAPPSSGPGPALPAPGAALPPPGSAASAALAGALGAPPAEDDNTAMPDVLDEKETIGGTIVLPPANRAKVSRGDVMFLAARRAGGPPGPGSMLAVQKLVAEDFPMRFSISRRDAMIPGVPFEGRLSITIRVDKDGDAMTRRKGDVYGQVENVSVGSQKVVITLDKVQTEDRTLGQPGAAVGGMLPPGHP